MNRTKKITFIAVFAALLAVCAQIAIPLPTGVSLTLQTFSVALCGFVLGPFLGASAIVVYIALGAVGLPVFTGFNSTAAIVGPTGGFIFGFIPFAALCGKKSIPFGIIGLLLCHIAGFVRYSFFANIPLWSAFVTVSLPYLIKDAVSVLLAYYISKRITKAMS